MFLQLIVYQFHRNQARYSSPYHRRLLRSAGLVVNSPMSWHSHQNRASLAKYIFLRLWKILLTSETRSDGVQVYPVEVHLHQSDFTLTIFNSVA